MIFNEVPIQQYYALPTTAGRATRPSARRCCTSSQDNVKNVVFLTTDVHANLVNDARFNTLGDRRRAELRHPRRHHRPDRDRDLLGRDQRHSSAIRQRRALIQTAFLKPQPPNGVGMQCAATDQFSYAEVEVTKSRLTIDLLDADDQPVLDTGDASTPARRRARRVVITKQ